MFSFRLLIAPPSVDVQVRLACGSEVISCPFGRASEHGDLEWRP
jgi:hypothetical protein